MRKWRSCEVKVSGVSQSEILTGRTDEIGALEAAERTTVCGAWLGDLGLGLEQLGHLVETSLLATKLGDRGHGGRLDGVNGGLERWLGGTVWADIVDVGGRMVRVQLETRHVGGRMVRVELEARDVVSLSQGVQDARCLQAVCTVETTPVGIRSVVGIQTRVERILHGGGKGVSGRDGCGWVNSRSVGAPRLRLVLLLRPCTNLLGSRGGDHQRCVTGRCHGILRVDRVLGHVWGWEFGQRLKGTLCDFLVFLATFATLALAEESHCERLNGLDLELMTVVNGEMVHTRTPELLVFSSSLCSEWVSRAGLIVFSSSLRSELVSRPAFTGTSVLSNSAGMVPVPVPSTTCLGERELTLSAGTTGTPCFCTVSIARVTSKSKGFSAVVTMERGLYERRRLPCRVSSDEFSVTCSFSLVTSFLSGELFLLRKDKLDKLSLLVKLRSEPRPRRDFLGDCGVAGREGRTNRVRL